MSIQFYPNLSKINKFTLNSLEYILRLYNASLDNIDNANNVIENQHLKRKEIQM